MLRNNQYLRLKGIKSFKEEGKAILNKLVSIEERKLLERIDFGRILNYPARQKLYERRLKLTKTLTIILKEMEHLEEENQDQVTLYMTQKSGFTAGLWMIIDQIDSVLRKDDKHRKDMGFQLMKSPTFYPTSIQLWSEMPVDIIRKASEEHKECMKSLDDVRTHTDIGKGSKQKDQTKIPSVTSAFQRVPPTVIEDHESSLILKERGSEEAISMTTKFQNPSRNSQQTETKVTQQCTNNSMFSTQSVIRNAQNEDSQWEHRQNRRNKALEQFIRKARRKGEMTAVYESKLRQSFRIRQEAEEKRLRAEEKKIQLLLDETLAKKI